MADVDMDDPHERRKARDRADQAARRARAKASGERLGHALDSLVIDSVALMLAGRPADDPVRVAFMRSVNRACWARGVAATPELVGRLHTRMSLGATLRTAIDERRLEAVGRG